uniref:NADH-ubiquinone oxidoreductase 75 kDa subunit, mitochondrial-like n=1 Tax=Drosophila rhopaloa TaxID=1041015 RepID=A0A6P4FST2_DRORH
MALRDLMWSLGSLNLDCRQDGAKYDLSDRSRYTFASGIVGIDEADAILVVGANPRLDAPVLNARIRKRYLSLGRGGLPIGVIGTLTSDPTWAYEDLGSNPVSVNGLLSGNIEFVEKLKAAKKPMIIVGQEALIREDSGAILAACRALAESVGVLTDGWNGLNILHTAASRVAALDLGFVPRNGGRSLRGMLSSGVDVLWLLGADEFSVNAISPETFVIYQGHHGDAGAARADVILPGSAYTEKSGTWVNTEGRIQRSFQAVFPPGEAKEDWKIIRAASEVLGAKLPYDTIEAL